jgi:hypothetical protein
MTKSTVAAVPALREVRPFLFLTPVAGQAAPQWTAAELDCLDAAVGEAVPMLVAGLVRFSLRERQDGIGRARQPVALSVLNRRRRAAREWINSVLAGAADAATLQALVSQWLPVLLGHERSPERAMVATAALFEYLRGAITALLFEQPAANLLPAAKGLHVLETVLARQLGACQLATPSLA